MGVIYLVRHGESVAQVEDKMGGVYPFPLSAKGVDQAYQVAESLRDVTFDAVYTSEVVRATETTQIILPIICKPGQQFTSMQNLFYDKDFNERSHGVWDSLSHDELENLFGPGILDVWMKDAYSHSPGGENLVDVYNRIIPPFYEKIYTRLQNSNEKILLVSHNRVMQAIMAFMYKKSAEDMQSYNIKNATAYNFLIR